MAKADTTTFSLYVTKDCLARIDKAAERQAVSRTEYVLSWLPEHHEPPSDALSETAHINATPVHR